MVMVARISMWHAHPHWFDGLQPVLLRFNLQWDLCDDITILASMNYLLIMYFS